MKIVAAEDTRDELLVDYDPDICSRAVRVISFHDILSDTCYCATSNTIIVYRYIASCVRNDFLLLLLLLLRCWPVLPIE